MDDFMMYKFLQEMKTKKDAGFIDKFREYMENKQEYRNHRDDPSWAFMPSNDKSHWDFYMRRDGMSPSMREDFYTDHNKHREEDDTIYKMMKYMKSSFEDKQDFDEESAKYIVSNMYHNEDGKKHIGEQYPMSKAKEICERYRGILPSGTKVQDVYIAINAQYHDYAELYKSWFGNNIDQKIIDSAVIFWFKDADYGHSNKVREYFKEY